MLATADDLPAAIDRPAILAGMTHQLDTTAPSAPLLCAVMGTVLMAIGGMLFVYVNGDPELLIVLTVAFTAPGLYMLITGAVAHRIRLARR